MCFNSKDGRDSGDLPPRPVSVRNSTDKKVNPGARQPQAEEYAPPPGPPTSSSRAPGNNNSSSNAISIDYAPPAGPPPSSRAAHNTSNAATDYAPPAGPPPSSLRAPNNGSSAATDYAPPAGPPPSSSRAGTDYAPPAGPPPGHRQAQNNNDDYTAPPPGPPPSAHDWQSAVPDTALLPPPPDLFSGWDRSPANNATEEQAEAGEAWCAAHPLSAEPLALQYDPATRQALATHNINVLAPSGYKAGALKWVRPGLWTVRNTDRHSPDTCLLSYPPLYAVALHSPLGGSDGEKSGSRSFTAYYEVYVRPEGRVGDEVSLALGFAALPYPAFRLPGWHRGSLGVHGDDGHRYVNDLWGGKTFTKPFRRGETYGLGMRFTADPGAASGTGIAVEVLFTRNGALDGRWDLHEEIDAAQDRPVTGLEGFHDLSLAIGTFNAVSFEVRLDPAQWAYKDIEA
ncbi:hypothetical protein SPI_08402 [Niveomyces insectorum RCEF 264]|uniref:SPRY domain-containing protein n=1 Tax=Niveomyces insectorum RCEF 264 TaxID=1081102 RepID=A0A167N9Y7_9HYPO|nr:hypothetical protein SPI_08402 [Niveomyces insectorum RCEF 264]